MGAIEVLRKKNLWKFNTRTPPHNATNVELYTFVTFSPGNLTPPHPNCVT